MNALLWGLIQGALLLPYETRLSVMGWAVRRLVGPIAGYRQAAKANLSKIFPEMSREDRRAIVEACLDNAGRTFIENYSGAAFQTRVADTPISGPGWPALQAAAAAERPVILVTGHYGNYEAVRAVLVRRGYPVGGLYRDLSNPYFNAHYVKTMQRFGGPVFPQGRRGTAGFVRHLRGGGQLVLLFDQHVFGAPTLDFLGHPARTAVSAAELALRYDAALIPFYGIRQPGGTDFRIELEAPIAASDPETMTQALNDSLAARIRQDPGQWFWVHRRWRPDAVAAVQKGPTLSAP